MGRAAGNYENKKVHLAGVFSFNSPVIACQRVFFNEAFFSSYEQYSFDYAIDKIYTRINSLNALLMFQASKIFHKLQILPYLIAATVIYVLYSYFLFCIFNTIIEVMTILKLKEMLSEKAKMSSRDLTDENNKTELRSIVMIVLNNVANFLLRLAELLSIILFFVMTNGSGTFLNIQKALFQLQNVFECL